MIPPSDTGGSSSGGGAGGPVFVRGQHLDQENAQVGGATCPNLINDRDTHPVIEFIHFGNVHTSLGNRFPHDSYKDNETVKPADETQIRPPVPIAKPRAIQFRSALERETILLAVFIESAQTVFAEKEGLLGSLASAVGALLGGGGVGSVKSSEMNGPLQKVMTVASTLNVASIQYHDTHKAGRDLHQARTDYRKLLTKVTGKIEKPLALAADPAGATPSADPDHQTALDHVKAAAASVKNAAKNAASSAQSGARAMMEIVDFAKSALLKKTDIKIMCFSLVAQQQERAIEQICHDMSLGAITASTMSAALAAAREKDRRKDTSDGGGSADDSDDSPTPTFGPRGNPFLPVWFAVTDDVVKSKQSMLHPDRVNSLLQTLNTDPLGTARVALEAKAKTALFGDSFFAVPDIMVPGLMFSAGVCDPPQKSVNKADPEPMDVGDLMCLGFAKVTGKNPLPGVVSELVKGIHDMVADFIRGVYDALLKRPSDQEITKSSLAQAISPESFASGIQSLTVSKLSNLISGTASEYSAVSVSGVNLGRVNAISDAGTDLTTKIEAAYAESATPVIIAAVRYAMGDLSQHLELARRDALSAKADVLEWYLGRLPYVQIDLFCAVFFPFWGVLMRCLLSAMDGPVASAMKSVLDAADKLNGAVQKTATETKQAASELTPDPSGGSIGNAIGDVTRAGGITGPINPSSLTNATSLNQFTNVDPASALSEAKRLAVVPALPITRGKFKLPFTARLPDGQGMDIEDYDDVKPNHQWEKALSPEADEKDDEDDAAKSGAAGAKLPSLSSLVKK